jgi:hypothetical protein
MTADRSYSHGSSGSETAPGGTVSEPPAMAYDPADLGCDAGTAVARLTVDDGL